MAYKDPEKQREYQREWVAKRRSEFFMDKVCADCGMGWKVAELELDHRDPAKKVSHSIWSWSKARREAEIAKCEIRCEPCHRARHQKLWVQHGTRKRYEKGCRCGLCLLAHQNHLERKKAA